MPYPETPAQARRARRAAMPRPKKPDPGQLSPHFHVKEFACHDGTPVPKCAYDALRRLCVIVLEPMRQKFGPCRVLSGYRHREYNRSIGGARYSQHIYDDGPESVAADVRFAKGSPKEWAAYADKLLPRGGVGRYDRSGFVHVDNRSYKARWKGN